MQTNEQLLLQLHEQFSSNQNDTVGKFLTLFIALLILFGAYGIAYGISIGYVKWNNISVSFNAVLLIAIVLVIVLTFLIVLQIYMGYQHRRDQFVNDKIRRKYVSDYNYIFSNYSGKGKGLIGYLPDNVLIYVTFLSSCKILLFISIISLPYLANSQSNIDSISNSNGIMIINQNNQVIGGSTIKKGVRPSSKTDSLKIEVTVNSSISSDTIPIKIVGENSSVNNKGDLSNCLYIITLIICICGFVIIITKLIHYHKKYNKRESKDEAKSENKTKSNDETPITDEGIEIKKLKLKIKKLKKGS